MTDARPRLGAIRKDRKLISRKAAKSAKLELKMIANDNAAPAVSIVVPCRNERDHIETVLQSILAQDPPLGGFEVIVAENSYTIFQGKSPIFDSSTIRII